MAQSSIDDHILSALKEFKKYGIGVEAFWGRIAENAGIPKEDSETVKNILSVKNYIYVSYATDSGDVVVGQPLIDVALYEISQKNETDMASIVSTLKGEPFDGDMIEREILIFAVSHFKNKPSPVYYSRLFPNKPLAKEKEYITAVLVESGLFEYENHGIQYSFKLTSKTTKNIFGKDAAGFIDEHLKGTTSHPLPFIQYNDNSQNSYGDNSPNVGKNLSARDFKKEENKETEESKAISKEGLKISKKTLTWTIVGILLALLIGLLALG